MQLKQCENLCEIQESFRFYLSGQLDPVLHLCQENLLVQLNQFVLQDQLHQLAQVVLLRHVPQSALPVQLVLLDLLDLSPLVPLQGLLDLQVHVLLQVQLHQFVQLVQKVQVVLSVHLAQQDLFHLQDLFHQEIQFLRVDRQDLQK